MEEVVKRLEIELDGMEERLNKPAPSTPSPSTEALGASHDCESGISPAVEWRALHARGGQQQLA